jgi:hypothetical protein
MKKPREKTLCWVYLSPNAVARGVRIHLGPAKVPAGARKWWRRKGAK